MVLRINQYRTLHADHLGRGTFQRLHTPPAASRATAGPERFKTPIVAPASSRASRAVVSSHSIPRPIEGVESVSVGIPVNPEFVREEPFYAQGEIVLAVIRRPRIIARIGQFFPRARGPGVNRLGGDAMSLAEQRFDELVKCDQIGRAHAVTPV